MAAVSAVSLDEVMAGLWAAMKDYNWVVEKVGVWVVSRVEWMATKKVGLTDVRTELSLGVWKVVPSVASKVPPKEPCLADGSVEQKAEQKATLMVEQLDVLKVVSMVHPTADESAGEMVVMSESAMGLQRVDWMAAYWAVH